VTDLESTLDAIVEWEFKHRNKVLRKGKKVKSYLVFKKKIYLFKLNLRIIENSLAKDDALDLELFNI
jgi:hypothetical protein